MRHQASRKPVTTLRGITLSTREATGLAYPYRLAGTLLIPEERDARRASGLVVAKRGEYREVGSMRPQNRGWSTAAALTHLAAALLQSGHAESATAVITEAHALLSSFTDPRAAVLRTALSSPTATEE